jgi:transposase
MDRQGKRAVFAEETVKRAEQVVNDLSYRDPVLMAVSVLMASKLKLTCVQIGEVLGVSRATVTRMNEASREEHEVEKKEWGGRRRQALTAEQEKETLAELGARAAAGEIVGAAQVKAHIEQKRGAPVSIQTAYNVLYRAGWRKVVPDKIHPKGDPEKQEEFKKKHSRKQSRWLPSKPQAPADH